ncbi:MAG TPA: ferritin-like protein [Acidimicrobiales bacterium]|nr:ferritin-like protein [Acidimicrobiales bacterium]
MPPTIVVEHRKELSYLLCQAAEIEHLAMCQYLYAAFSLRSRPGPGLTVEQLEPVERWRTELGRIAAEEMLHWALVNNLLTAIGSAPFVARPDLPHRAKGYPPSVQFALLPFGEDALHHFVYFERPEDVALADVDVFTPVGDRPPPMVATELQPRGQDFETQGQLYRSLDAGLRHLADSLGEDGLFIGPPWAQATPESFGWPALVPVTDLASALAALERIVEQGEGAKGDSTGSHYARFGRVLEELVAIRTEDPSFDPAYPVTAAVVRTVEGAEPTGPWITDVTTAAVSDLFNVVYDLLLQMLSRYFAFGHETGEQHAALADASVAMMFGTIRPLGLLLAELPVGDLHPGRTAGANFQLAYKSNFLLPHRRVAWIRFAERLDEAAAYAESITADGETRRVLDGVAKSLRQTLVRLSAHIESV